MSERVYLDHAATTPLRSEVLEAMLPYMGNAAMNPSGMHAASRRAHAALEEARSVVAHLIGAKSKEVYFTSGGTESDNWAMHALLTEKKRHIVTTSAEHEAILACARSLEQCGCTVTRIPVDSCARVILTKVNDALCRDDIAILSVMYANNETGAINDIRAVAEIAHERGVPLHSDAVAAAGHVPIAVDRDGIDMLSLSAHKMYGPPGCGILYIRSSLRPRGMLFGGRQERGLRAGTQNVAAAVGLARAFQLAVAELESETHRLREVRAAFERAIRSEVRSARFLHPKEGSLPGTLSILVPGLDAGAALIQLDRDGYEASAGAACSAGARTPSHVLAAAGIPPGDLRSVLRVTLGRSNTDRQAQGFAQSLAQAAGRVSGAERGN